MAHAGVAKVGVFELSVELKQLREYQYYTYRPCQMMYWRLKVKASRYIAIATYRQA